MKIKNMLFQPLTLQLAADNTGLHLIAREVKEVLEHQVSDEIRRAAARGLVSLTGDENEETASVDDPSENTRTPADTAVSSKKGARR